MLADRSGRYSPDGWARAAIRLYDELQADYIVAEANQGGDMVKFTLDTVDADVPVRLVHATRGKRVRAEPIAALDEQGRIHHVGPFAALEDQMVNWVPDMPGDSPDRVDARVWALTELMLGRKVEYDAQDFIHAMANDLEYFQEKERKERDARRQRTQAPPVDG